ncbi:MAG TPA: metallophosphoesterase [Methanobacterium sp.]|nr:metallophosphoesterase [Methanobacterium sp.]
MRKKIIHMSDLHFSEYTYSEDLKNNLLAQVEDENPDLIIVSGDITSQGYTEEYIKAREFINELKSISEIYTVPGNHDACNVGLKQFKKHIGHRKFVHHDINNRLVIVGLDSSEPDIHDGQIGIDQRDWLIKKLRKISEDMRVIVTFHHHLLPIPQTGRERNILLDAGDIIKILMEYKVDVVLNGHKHVPHAWKLEKLITINSGTATTRRLHSGNYPSYNLIELGEDELDVKKVNTETGFKEELACYPLEFKGKIFKSRIDKTEKGTIS